MNQHGFITHSGDSPNDAFEFPVDVVITGRCKAHGSLTIEGDLTVTGSLVVRGLSRDQGQSALVVMDPVTREVGRVTGLTVELRPIVTFDSGAVRSRSWSDLVLGEGRAW